MTITEILHFLDRTNIQYSFYGDRTTEIDGYSSLKNYKKNTVTWAKNELAYAYGFQDKLLVIAQEGLHVDAQNVISSSKSKLAFFSLIEFMEEQKSGGMDSEEKIGKGTVIGEHVKIGENVRIGSNCVIQGNVELGEGCRIWNNVTIINDVKIGADCEIQSGCVIGHDGFAWNENDMHEKTMIKHYGGVVIQDRVYMGPNCIVDRGEIDDTTIGSGVKIDANCFIAHNVKIGKNAVLITGSRLYGSSELGDNSYVASATIRNQCKVGKNSFVGMGSVVVKEVPDNTVVAGVPATVMQIG